MAPRESKVTPKVQRIISKTNKPSMSTTSGIKKIKKTVEQTPRKENATAVDCRPRTNTAPTPRPKEDKPAACPGSVTKSAKKSWKRRPKPAHSGVPVPEKMKRILQQRLLDSDCSF